MNEQNKSDMVIYNDGELELNVSIENETVWLNRNQIAELFSKYTNLKIKIYTQTISKQLRLDYQKYSSQYKNIELLGRLK